MPVPAYSDSALFYRYSIRTRIKTFSAAQVIAVATNSIVIPLEQGLRQSGLSVLHVVTSYSIVIPLEQGLRQFG